MPIRPKTGTVTQYTVSVELVNATPFIPRSDPDDSNENPSHVVLLQPRRAGTSKAGASALSLWPQLMRCRRLHDWVATKVKFVGISRRGNWVCSKRIACGVWASGNVEAHTGIIPTGEPL